MKVLAIALADIYKVATVLNHKTRKKLLTRISIAASHYHFVLLAFRAAQPDLP